jgi:parvulin-like peptidyl-prolyl isomerase
MTVPQVTRVQAGQIEISGEDVFASLHRRGQLLPVFRGVAIEAMMEAAARTAGLNVSDQELQAASDQYRRELGLQSAEKTRDWLAEERLSVEQFERRIELDVLTEKFKDYLLAEFGERHYQLNAGSLAPVKLRRIIQPSLSQARELFVQLHEEGADFAELARKYCLDPHARQTSGDLGMLLRKQLRTEIADAVFSTKEGSVTAPVHGPDWYEVYLVEQFPTSTFDDLTQAAVRDDLFQTFISLNLRDINISSPHFAPFDTEPVSANAKPRSSVSTLLC